ncbi:MAG: hypothetical protein ABIG64_07345 [Candidatus Omnitrophota bacterium]
MRRKIFYLFSLMLAYCCITHYAFAEEGIDNINTDNYANKTLSFYYYIPESIKNNPQQAYPLLVMVPGLSGQGQGLVDQAVKLFAETNSFFIIAPSFIFDQQNWQDKKSYHYPDAWSGKAFLNIVNSFQAKQNVMISKYYLFGHSAGAQFVLRFSLWKPQLCAACAAHASGGWIKIKETVNVKYFISVGTQDSQSRKNITDNFLQNAQAHYISVIFKQYNTSHALIPEQIQDSLDFFAKIAQKSENSYNHPKIKSVPGEVIAEPSQDFVEEVEVFLTTGRSTKGRIVEQNEKKLTLEILMGSSVGTITISKAKILKIEKIK